MGNRSRFNIKTTEMKKYYLAEISLGQSTRFTRLVRAANKQSAFMKVREKYPIDYRIIIYDTIK